jgi:hypothetical protein
MENGLSSKNVASLKDAYSLFVFGIRTQITRDYYLRRLRTFFDFIKLLPGETMETRCNYFAAIGIKDMIVPLLRLLVSYNFKRKE